jgi:hypothetical protein
MNGTEGTGEMDSTVVAKQVIGMVIAITSSLKNSSLFKIGFFAPLNIIAYSPLNSFTSH